MRARTGHLRSWVAVAAAALLASACGSTLSGDEQARLEESATRGGTVLATTGEAAGEVEGDIAPSDAGATTDPAAPGATTAAGGTATSGGTTTRRAGTTSGGAATGAAAGGADAAVATGAGETAAGPSGPGVTDTEIRIGLVYDKNAGTTNAALGFGGLIGQIDAKRAADALIAEVNRTGGVAGRKLKAVYHVADSTDGKTAETVAQEICATFTQDNRVFAAMISGTDTLRSCLSKAGVVQVASGAGLSDATTFQQYPYLVEVGRPALDRMVRFAAESWKAAGFYDTGRDGPVPAFKLGVVLYDDPVFQRALVRLREALQAQGITISETAAIKRANSTAAIGDETNAIRAAALQFKEKNVTHVHFLATSNAFQQLTFMQSAEKQIYRPRYGLTSNDGGQALATLLQGDAPNQLKSSLSVGWFPLFDVTPSDYSGDAMLPAFKRCKKILQDAGETFGDGDPTRNKEAQAAVTCDPFFYLQAAGNFAGKQLTKETFLRGVAQVQSLESAQTFIMRTTAERRDAMGGYRDVKWFENCSCFKYVSGVREV